MMEAKRVQKEARDRMRRDIGPPTIKSQQNDDDDDTNHTQIIDP